MSNDQNAASDPGSMLTAAQLAILDAVLNLIVPPSADGRMPGAAEVGVPAYLFAEAPDAVPVLRLELEELEQGSRGRYALGFAELKEGERRTLIESMRAQAPSFLSRLAMETLACYYQHDRVLEGLGMEARPPYPKGYQVVQGDLSLLAPVRARGKIYRDVT
ncbi:MAG TPA: gluconate 2-dehydrogenase subunit 3 family protein [Burkholderiales bacterium]|nr:gluconate 2-dehydrogenase subunit 3 family protein [Burkholderiales bacterium]